MWNVVSKQHSENTPEIEFELQEDKQLSTILELYF